MKPQSVRLSCIDVQGTTGIVAADRSIHGQGLPSTFDDAQPYQRARSTPASLRRLAGGNCGSRGPMSPPTNTPATALASPSLQQTPSRAGCWAQRFAAGVLIEERRAVQRSASAAFVSVLPPLFYNKTDRGADRSGRIAAATATCACTTTISTSTPRLHARFNAGQAATAPLQPSSRHPHRRQFPGWLHLEGGRSRA
jgi:hypothetical protein